MHCLFNGNAFTKPTIYYMSNNNLQLYRNDVYFNDKTTAKNALQSQLEKSSDGELVISRYAVKDDNGAVTDVKTLFGFAASGSTDRAFTTIFDYDDLSTNSKLEELKFNEVIATWNKEKTSLTVLASASDIKTSSEYSAITYSAIGDTIFESIGAEESIESALSKIESNISTLIQVIIENEFVTANSLTKFNESAGFANGEYSADENDAHLSGATSLKHADTLLSEAIDSVEDRITQLENNSSIIGSDTITIENSTVSITENLDIYCGEY